MERIVKRARRLGIRRVEMNRKRAIILIVAILLVPIILFQLFYPRDMLLPNTTVGTLHLGAISKKEAAKALDLAYATTKVPVYFTDSDEVVVQPTLTNLGFSIKNEAREDAYDYPLFVRFVPYSLFWYQAVMGKGEPQVSQDVDALVAYATERFGADCEFAPVDGTIVYDAKAVAGVVSGAGDDSAGLRVVDAARGGSCDFDELLTGLKKVEARLTPEKVLIEGTSTAPEVSTQEAQVEFNRLQEELGDGVALNVEDKTEIIDKNVVAQWVTYMVVDGKLLLEIDDEKAGAWLSSKYGDMFTSDAGVTVVTLRDYAEKSRDVGKVGQALNTDATNDEIAKDLKGKQSSAKLVVDAIKPAIEYKWTYSPSDAKLSAVMKNYADTHGGVYGVKMVELSGERRNAAYQSTREFTTASTYKLFVAYSILLRIERGEIAWTDPSYGNWNVSTCFDKMLQLSNNECSIWFLLKVSYEGVTADAHDLGATHTHFVRNTGIKSTADDEAHFLSLLYSNQLLTQQASRDRFIETMKGNIYVSGIPSGIPNATVADKVGFLDGLLHDAAIVYSPKGDYVLVILTDGASWGNIAELAGEIEAAR